MIKNNHTKLSLTFYFTKGLGIVNARNILNILNKDPDNFYLNGRELLQGKLNYKITELLFSDKIKRRVDKELDLCIKNNITIIPFWDENFPKNLHLCKDSPILIFQKGNINWNSDKIISIVGTRNITSYGKRCIDKIIDEIKKYNPIIISGLAYGVDIYAHKKALENNLQTISILGTGINNIYPSEHSNILNKMLENGGACTEFPFNSPPARENFPKRNRIIAGISNATIVIESKKKGGSIITAEIANLYNKDVFAVPGRVGDICSEGCNSLISKNKANIYTSVADLEYFLNWDKRKNPIQKTLFLDLSREEESILNEIEKYSKIHIDELAINLNTHTFKLTPILLKLEIKGAIESFQGKTYSKI